MLKVITFLAIILLVGGSNLATAQNRDTKPKAERKSGWEHRFKLRLGVAYDDNVFRLSEGRKRAVNGEGRYEDMNNAHDVIGNAEAALTLRGRGIGARRLLIEPRASFEAYALNPRRSHADVGLGVTQSISGKDRVRFDVGFAPSVYRRNYLAGSDFTFAPGIYSEWRGRAGYERELAGKDGVDAEGEIGVLMLQRTYNDLSWRDRSEIGAEAAARFRLTRALRLHIDGMASRHSFDSQPEPVIINSGVVMMTLNRDRKEYQVGIEPRLRLGKDLFLQGRYEYMKRAFDAALNQDAVYGGRSDERNTYRGELRFPYRRTANMRVGAQLEAQSTSRPSRGENDDETDFRRLVGYLRVEFPR